MEGGREGGGVRGITALLGGGREGEGEGVGSSCRTEYKGVHGSRVDIVRRVREPFRAGVTSSVGLLDGVEWGGWCG